MTDEHREAPLTAQQAATLLRIMDRFTRHKHCSDAELVWRLLRLRAYGESDGTDLGSLIDEIVDRFFPAWDGETLQLMEWGWRTPFGDIRYD